MSKSGFQIVAEAVVASVYQSDGEWIATLFARNSGSLVKSDKFDDQDSAKSWCLKVAPDLGYAISGDWESATVPLQLQDRELHR
jgi:hypothetical protein